MRTSTSFTVQAGQTVNLTLENVATLDVMLHNVVILSSNEDDVANRVGMAALVAGEASGFIPDDQAILAYTPLAQPGETVQVTFEAPAEPGPIVISVPISVTHPDAGYDDRNLIGLIVPFFRVRECRHGALHCV